jgi:hypothetical protein
MVVLLDHQEDKEIQVLEGLKVQPEQKVQLEPQVLLVLQVLKVQLEVQEQKAL